MKLHVNVKLDKGAKMPTKAHSTDAGFDLYTPYEFTVKASINSKHLNNLPELLR